MRVCCVVWVWVCVVCVYEKDLHYFYIDCLANEMHMHTHNTYSPQAIKHGKGAEPIEKTEKLPPSGVSDMGWLLMKNKS